MPFRLSDRIWFDDSTTKVGLIRSALAPESRILDIGAGPGYVTQLLQQEGHAVTGIDIANLSRIPDWTPTLYDGTPLSYTDGSFDTALLLTVLHHTSDPDALLVEAARVARQLIVIEDVHTHRLHKALTCFMDSLVNNEWRDHPHSNRSDAEWKAAFEHLGLELMSTQNRTILRVFRQHIYRLTTA